MMNFCFARIFFLTSVFSLHCGLMNAFLTRTVFLELFAFHNFLIFLPRATVFFYYLSPTLTPINAILIKLTSCMTDACWRITLHIGFLPVRDGPLDIWGEGGGLGNPTRIFLGTHTCVRIFFRLCTNIFLALMDCIFSLI